MDWPHKFEYSKLYSECILTLFTSKKPVTCLLDLILQKIPPILQRQIVLSVIFVGLPFALMSSGVHMIETISFYTWKRVPLRGHTLLILLKFPSFRFTSFWLSENVVWVMQSNFVNWVSELDPEFLQRIGFWWMNNHSKAFASIQCSSKIIKT